MNPAQQQMLEYLREENRVLREQLGDRRLRLNDDQRRRLATKAKGLGRKRLVEVAGIVTPETLMAWQCVQRKAGMFSGGQSRRGNSQNPVAWVAFVEETKRMKPTDKAALGAVSESPGRNESEPTDGPDTVSAEAESSAKGRRHHDIPQPDRGEMLLRRGR